MRETKRQRDRRHETIHLRPEAFLVGLALAADLGLPPRLSPLPLSAHQATSVFHPNIDDPVVLVKPSVVAAKMTITRDSFFKLWSWGGS